MARVLRPAWWRGPSIDRGVADTPKRLYPVRYDIKRSHFSLLFGNRHVTVSAWTSRPTNFILFIDRLLRLWHCTRLPSDSQHNPRPRIVAGHPFD